MKINELIDYLSEGLTFPEGQTCDTLKTGDGEREVQKVAVTMIATVEVIRQAKRWGADFLITHEPTFYDHMDRDGLEEPVAAEKRRLLEEAGITVWRYHDHPHAFFPDRITSAELEFLGVKGEIRKSPFFAAYLVNPEEPVTARQLKARFEADGVRHVRAVGAIDQKIDTIAACFGTPGGIKELIQSPEVNLMMVGEACEWQIAEYVRDAAALGYNKSILVIGHIPSEREGMKVLARRMERDCTAFETRYFECGEVYLP